MTPSFNDLRVLVLESRRSTEMAALVRNHGGRPLSAPALQEVPLASNTDALVFIDALIGNQIDLVVLLTGVGTRALLAVVDQLRDRASFLAALGRVPIVARGPKPVAVLRELGLTPWLVAPEPNTWRELLVALDGRSSERPLPGLRIALQEYGASNPLLIEALQDRGATIIRVPVYRWALPDDVGPLRAAARALATGEVDVVLFTTATQVVHLLQVAASIGLDAEVRRGLTLVAVASIGPTTSEELREQSIAIDIEASHPKMGFLVREGAERGGDVLRTKRAGRALG